MSLSESRVHRPSVPNTIAAGWRRVMARLRPARFGSQITYGVERSLPASSGLVVGVIDDPELAMRLLSVRGRVSPKSLAALAAAFDEVDDGSQLHLDLTDAEFTERLVVRSLAGLLDQLDDRRVHLRIVGLGRYASIPVD